MKKYFALMMALLMLTLAGCAQKTDTPPAGEPEPVEEPASKLDEIKEAGVITMCTSPDYAPYEFEDLSKEGQDKYVGADIELGKYIAEKLGVTLEVKAMDFNTCLEAVKQGTVDMGIAGFAYKEDRAESMLLVGPYNVGNGYQGLLIPADKADEYKTVDDFAGKKIAAQVATLQYDLVVQQTPGAEVVTVTTIQDGVMMVQTGKVDALCILSTVGEEYTKQYDTLAMSEVQYFTMEGTYVLVAKEFAALAEALQPIVEEADSSGLYAKWVEEAKELAAELGID
ncbi:MAG TPA: transporter substrate-binding domain-containing protein [Candidatus Acidoferrum sp.]|nr:transporter substrate-binding domain-containing protein [Candidatus Acidoferrum sp.]